jgi:hypothetical protein
VTTDGNPWADPGSPATPYAGPPSTEPPPYGYATPGYGTPYPPPYGYPPPWPVPSAPRRPGQVVAAAVLAFVQAAVVVVSSLYVVLFSSLIDLARDADPSSAPPAAVAGLAREGTVLGIVQVVSAVLLIVGGVLALNSRRPRALVALVVAFGVQVLLCIYWAVRLSMIVSDIPGAGSTGAFLAFTLVFLAGPAVGLGLVLLGPGRRWFDPAR